MNQGNLFHREIKLKYINVYAEVVACTYQRHVTLRHFDMIEI